MTKLIVTAALTISLVVSGCASLGQSSGLTIRIPEPPMLRSMPRPVPCTDDGRGDCVNSLRSDWIVVLDYLSALRRELEGACIKIGQVTLPPDWKTNEAQREEAKRLIQQECYAK